MLIVLVLEWLFLLVMFLCFVLEEGFSKEGFWKEGFSKENWGLAIEPHFLAIRLGVGSAQCEDL